MFFDDNTKIGVCSIVISGLLGALGVFLFFDRAILSMANILFLLGVILLIGVKKALVFFTRYDKWKGSFAFLLGVAVIVYGFPIIGLLIEVVGLWWLFSTFFPQVLSSVKATPFGFILELPGISWVSKWVFDQRRLPL